MSLLAVPVVVAVDIVMICVCVYTPSRGILQSVCPGGSFWLLVENKVKSSVMMLFFLFLFLC